MIYVYRETRNGIRLVERLFICDDGFLKDWVYLLYHIRDSG